LAPNLLVGKLGNILAPPHIEKGEDVVPEEQAPCLDDGAIVGLEFMPLLLGGGKGRRKRNTAR